MSGILRLESLTKGNTLKQGDKTPLKYRLFDADGEKLNIAGKSAVVRLMYPDFLRVGYESESLTVSSDNTVTFSIDKVIQPLLYYLEITVDGKYIFPSRNDESKFNIDKSSQGSDVAIIEIIGKDVLVRDIKNMVDSEIEPVVNDMIVSNQKVIENEKIVKDVQILSEQLETRQNQVEQFNNQVITEMTDKDVISAPEIILARGGEDTLGERLDKEYNEVTTQLVHIVHDVSKYIVDSDRDGVLTAISLAKSGDTIFFPSREITYEIGLIETDKKLTFQSNGVINGTIKPKTDAVFTGIEFKDVSLAIDLSETNGKVTIENCSFENVESSIMSYGDGLTEINDLTIKDNSFKSSISPIFIRNKRVNNSRIINNVFQDIQTPLRYAVAVRLGTANDAGQSINDWYIGNVLISGNSFKNILNTGSGSDWESGGIQVFAENIIVKDNHFNDIERSGNADCEAVYSKGYNILVENNIFNNAGGNEGTVVLKRNATEKAGSSRIQNNLFIIKEKNINSYNEIGVLLSMSDVVVTNNTFINYNHGVETYGFGAEGLTVESNEFLNVDVAVNNRVTDVVPLEKDLLIINNVVRESFYVVRTATAFQTNASMIIENNMFKKIKSMVFDIKGVIKKIVISKNNVGFDENHSSIIIETNISHPQGMELYLNSNDFDDTSGRLLHTSNPDGHYNYVEINNNLAKKAERGFRMAGTIDFMVAMNNNLIQIDGFQFIASPTTYYRVNNLGVEDLTT